MTLTPLVLADLTPGLVYVNMFAFSGHEDGAQFLALKEGVIQRIPFALGRTLFVDVIERGIRKSHTAEQLLGQRDKEENLVRAFRHTTTNINYLRRLILNRRVDEYFKIIGVDPEKGYEVLEKYRETNRTPGAQQVHMMFYS